MLIQVNKLSTVPIYEQVIQQIERQILLELLQPDDELPSVRSLAQTLGVNPNTLQKAYQELLRRNICYSVPGVGRKVSEQALKILRKETQNKIGELNAIVEKLALAGCTYEDICASIKGVFGQIEKVQRDSD